MKKAGGAGEEEGEEFWSKGAFAEKVSRAEMKERVKTIRMKHNEKMLFNCRKCNAKISAHNKDWHDRMCDKCFNKKYFPDNE